MTLEQINREPSRNHSDPASGTQRAPPTQFGPKAQVRIYNMRCPSCAKLYKVDAKDILSSSPHFDCQFCRTQFTFDYPPRHPHSIPTRPLKLSNFSPVPELAPIPVASSDRADGLPLEPNTDFKSRALPALMRAWQELLNDYENITKHLAFVDRCEDLQAVPFALKKYQALREAQPQDEVAQKMFERVWMKSLANRADRMVVASRVMLLVNRVNWPRVIKMAPWALYMLMILVGSVSASLRNMVGIGVSLLFLHLGLRLFYRGRLGLDDFI